MIFQAYQTLEDINGTGINGILQTAAEAVPVFPALILVAVFIVLAYASYYATQRRSGKGDLPVSCAAAGLVVFVVGLFFSLIPNFININILAITFALEVAFVVWLFFSGKRD